MRGGERKRKGVREMSSFIQPKSDGDAWNWQYAWDKLKKETERVEFDRLRVFIFARERGSFFGEKKNIEQ